MAMLNKSPEISLHPQDPLELDDEETHGDPDSSRDVKMALSWWLFMIWWSYGYYGWVFFFGMNRCC